MAEESKKTEDEEKEDEGNKELEELDNLESSIKTYSIPVFLLTFILTVVTFVLENYISNPAHETQLFDNYFPFSIIHFLILGLVLLLFIFGNRTRVWSNRWEEDGSGYKPLSKSLFKYSLSLLYASLTLYPIQIFIPVFLIFLGIETVVYIYISLFVTAFVVFRVFT